jgi:hypothetical protein
LAAAQESEWSAFFRPFLEKILGPAFTVRGGEYNKKDRLEILSIKDPLN